MSDPAREGTSLNERLPGDDSPEGFAGRLERQLVELLSGPSRDNPLAYRSWFSRSFSPALGRELVETGADRALVETHHDFCSEAGRAGPEEAPELRRSEAARLLRTVLLHHGAAVIRDPRHYEPGGVPGELELTVSTRRSRLPQWKSVTRAIIWLLSAVTSFTGTTHLAGWLLTPLLLQVSWLTPWRWHLRMALAVVMAVAISHVVLLFKRAIEHRMLRGQRAAAGACLDAALRDRAGRPRSPAFLVVALLVAAVLLSDAATNITGVFVFFGSYKDHTDQIQDRRAEIDARLAGMRGELSALPAALTARAEQEVERLLAEEEAGQSVTQAPGRGVMYWSKAALLRGEAGAWAELEALPGGAGACGALRDDAAVRIRREGLPGGGLAAAVGAVAAAHTAEIDETLQQIEARAAGLQPGDAIETLQRELDATNALFVGAAAQLNQALPAALEAQLGGYNAVLADFSRASRESGCFTRPAPVGVAGLRFEPVDVDTRPIELTPMAFRSPLELVGVVLRLPFYQALPILLLAPLVGFCLSHLDALFLPGLRRLYGWDMEASREASAQLEGWVARGGEVLALALNEGPCAAFFKDARDVISPEEAREALLRASAPDPEDALLPPGAGLGPLDRLLSWWSHVDTEVAREHNRRVEHVRDLFARPRRLGRVLSELLPGLRQLEYGAAGPGARRHFPDREQVRAAVRRGLGERTFSAEIRGLTAIDRKLGALEDLIRYEWLELIDDAGAREGELLEAYDALDALSASLAELPVESAQCREYKADLERRIGAMERALSARDEADAPTQELEVSAQQAA